MNAIEPDEKDKAAALRAALAEPRGDEPGRRNRFRRFAFGDVVDGRTKIAERGGEIAAGLDRVVRRLVESRDHFSPPEFPVARSRTMRNAR